MRDDDIVAQTPAIETAIAIDMHRILYRLQLRPHTHKRHLLLSRTMRSPLAQGQFASNRAGRWLPDAVLPVTSTMCRSRLCPSSPQLARDTQASVWRRRLRLRLRELVFLVLLLRCYLLLVPLPGSPDPGADVADEIAIVETVRDGTITDMSGILLLHHGPCQRRRRRWSDMARTCKNSVDRQLDGQRISTPLCLVDTSPAAVYKCLNLRKVSHTSWGTTARAPLCEASELHATNQHLDGINNLDEALFEYLAVDEAAHHDGPLVTVNIQHLDPPRAPAWRRLHYSSPRLRDPYGTDRQ